MVATLVFEGLSVAEARRRACELGAVPMCARASTAGAVVVQLPTRASQDQVALAAFKKELAVEQLSPQKQRVG